METAYIDIIGGTYQYFDKGVSSQRVSNMYAEDIESEGGKVKRILRPMAGYISRLALSVGGVGRSRGIMFSSTGPNGVMKLWMVAGDKLIRVNADYSYVVVGTISNLSSKVALLDNGFDVLVIDGLTAWKASITAIDSMVASTFGRAVLPINPDTGNPITPSTGTWLNRRFIVDSGTNTFFYSDLNSTTFQTLSNYEAEGVPDAIIGIAQVQNRVYVFGSRSYEVWTMDGTDDDPMSPIQGTASQIGCMAKDSIATLSDRVFWLGASDAGRFTVFVGTGLGDPKRISDNALEEQIQALAQPASCEGFCFMSRGHLIYVLNFIFDAVSFGYDASTDKWFTLSNIDADTGRTIAYQPCRAVSGFDGKLFAISGDTQYLIEISDSLLDYNGVTALREYVTPIMWTDTTPINLREVQLDISLGSTDETDPLLDAYEPKVMLSVSKDSGHTFVAREWMSMGRIGEYLRKPPRWSNLGYGRGIVLKFSISSKINFTIRGVRCTTTKVARR